MNDLLKYLIEKAKSHPWSAEVLLLTSILGVFFVVVLYLHTEPEAYSLLQNHTFQVGAVLPITGWAASVPWRYRRHRALSITVSSVAGILGLSLATWIYQTGKLERFRVTVIFDDSIVVTPPALNELVALLRTPMLDLEVFDQRLVVTASPELREGEARSALSQATSLFRKTDGKPPLPVLVTRKNLVGREWSSILSLTWADGTVISTWGVATEASLNDPVVMKYVATSTLRSVLWAKATERGVRLLADSPPGVHRGCLYDFHRTRQTYILQSQRPELCPAEATGVSFIFGDSALSAVKEVFSRIGTN